MSDALDNKPAIDFADAGEGGVYVLDSGRLLKRDLIERVKELNCLYGISRLMENRDFTVDQILERVADLIPPAWQFPDITGACISVDKRKYQTANYRSTPWELSESISVNGREAGRLQIGYLEPKPEADDGPFLKEEKVLIHVLAQRLGSIIEHKRAEISLQSLYRREKRLRQRLQKEMQSRVGFTRELIHELKTPLTSLLATSQYLVLLEQTQGTELGKVAGLVWEGANRLNHRIDELHDVVRGEVGTLKLNLKPTRVIPLLDSTLEETEALIRELGISISIEAEKFLPEVMADAERIRQVLLNLINNACKYAPEGKQIVIRAARDSASTVRIEVCDRGPGIARNRQKVLFKPGYQIDRRGVNPGGLGIGLTLCKMLIGLHGGKIWVESKLHHGSSFFFTLRVAGESGN